MEEKIKTAEEEKEALKQKIAELEIAAKQGPPSSNGSNEVNSKLSISHFSFIICTLSSSEVMRIKILISARKNILMHHQFYKLFVCTVENTFFFNLICLINEEVFSSQSTRKTNFLRFPTGFEPMTFQNTGWMF